MSDKAPTPISMAAISAVLNPIGAHDDKAAINLFYTQKKEHTLVLEQRDFKGSNSTILGDEAGEGAPVVKNPSTLVAMNCNGVMQVYGVLNKGDSIAMLSPVFQPLGQGAIASKGYLAGCSSGTQAWVFWEDVDGDKKPVIMQARVSGGKLDISDIGAESVNPGTRISAFHDGEDGWVVFQKDDHTLAAKPLSGAPQTSIQGDDANVNENTHICSHFVPAAQLPQDGANKIAPGAHGRVFVYWLRNSGDKNILVRSHADIMSDTQELTFSTPKDVESKSPHDIRTISQLSVVTDKDHQQNIVYSLENKHDKFGAIKDSWFAKP